MPEQLAAKLNTKLDEWAKEAEKWRVKASKFAACLRLIESCGGKTIDGVWRNGSWCAEQARRTLEDV